jgi:general secretion pathway protein K
MIATKNSRRRASVLMIALWSLFILASFAVILGQQVRQKMVLLKRLEARDDLGNIAEAAVGLGIAQIIKIEDAPASSLKDAWSMNPDLKDIPIADGKASLVRQLPEPAAEDQNQGYGLEDEESKININKADLRVLTALMQVVLQADETQAQSLAASIIDWRDADSELTVPLGSGEDSYYRNEKFPYESKDAPFQVLDELLLVKGFDTQTFEKLKKYSTIHGSGRVNINTAAPAVLYSVGFPRTIVDTVLSVRAGKDSIAGTEDDFVFLTTQDVVPEVSKATGLSPSEMLTLNTIADQYLTVKSTAFMITSVAVSANQKDTASVGCVIDAEGKILAYQKVR